MKNDSETRNNGNGQVRCRQRVAEHGEVFTSIREVNAMLDLVKNETERIESRFLEPACGTGNFLTEILRRKLNVVERRYKKFQFDFERNAVVAVSSIYGIDILENNVIECRERLYDIFYNEYYHRLFGGYCKIGCCESVRYILERNIIFGDALTLKTMGENSEYILFSEWSPINGYLIKRRDFTFHELLDNEMLKEYPVFSDQAEKAEYNPQPEDEYRPIHFLEVANVEKQKPQP